MSLQTDGLLSIENFIENIVVQILFAHLYVLWATFVHFCVIAFVNGGVKALGDTFIPYSNVIIFCMRASYSFHLNSN